MVLISARHAQPCAPNQCGEGKQFTPQGHKATIARNLLVEWRNGPLNIALLPALEADALSWNGKSHICTYVKLAGR